MLNFSPLAAEIVSLVRGTPANFNGFRVLAALLHSTLVVGVSQTAVFNRGRHLYSAGQPSRWALAHILVYFTLVNKDVRCRGCCRRLERWLWELCERWHVERERNSYSRPGSTHCWEPVSDSHRSVLAPAIIISTTCRLNGLISGEQVIQSKSVVPVT